MGARITLNPDHTIKDYHLRNADATRWKKLVAAVASKTASPHTIPYKSCKSKKARALLDVQKRLLAIHNLWLRRAKAGVGLAPLYVATLQKDMQRLRLQRLKICKSLK